MKRHLSIRGDNHDCREAAGAQRRRRRTQPAGEGLDEGPGSGGKVDKDKVGRHFWEDYIISREKRRFPKTTLKDSCGGHT